MKRRIFLLLLLQPFIFSSFSQTTFPSNGAPYDPHTLWAFVNAVIATDYETTYQNGTLLVQNGKVLKSGEKISVPPHARVIDLKGKYIYPAFIDLYSEYGLPALKTGSSARRPQLESSRKGAFGWNEAIHAETEALKIFRHAADNALELKKTGFAAVLSASKDGIVRGSGVLVHLNDSRKENESVIIGRAAGFYSFHKGSSTQDYPTSLTGGIALLRQTYYDAMWYKGQQSKDEFNISLEEFNRLQELPSIFEGNDKYNSLRAAKIGNEFGVKYLIKGAGNEYQRAEDIRKTFLRYIIPVNFPLAFDVEDPYEAELVDLSDLKHWDLAPANPAILEKNNVAFCFTTSGLKDKSLFLSNVRKAIKYGLSEKYALRALTANPALFINAYDRIGALKENFYADFIITNKPIFSDDAVIIQTWVRGEPTTFADLDMPDIRGNYQLNISATSYTVRFSGQPGHPKGEILKDTVKKSFNYRFTDRLLTFSFQWDSSVVRGSGAYSDSTKSFVGRGQFKDGSWFRFTLRYNSAADSGSQISSADRKPDPGKIIYPFCAYGEPLPETQGTASDLWNKFRNRYSAILIKDANVWTNVNDSVLKGYDVYIVQGRIVRVAPNIDAPQLAYAKVINASGMHLTPGIIDEHSHIALTAGVNEAGEASSAEVRMGDVINPEDVNIYRQLSGGVTTSQLLHGSANPIGGQSALIKLRWGLGAEELKFEKAPAFIKFALGENVKQSNWGDHNNVRFPQSRMGVEQVYTDYFIRAREYDQRIKSIANNKAGYSLVRKDLELEALAEILNGTRFITCHSYVQSEINMLLHVADSLKFKVNTFTHILEGYKVADKMKAHGAFASTFSDWWAYKNEVMEAIPYNAALLTRAGVVTAINSDDAEMARRLNHEAAKSIKYGGLNEFEALKLITLNPAKMLHIDDKVGSIAPGKSGDVVLWTDHPLSVYAKVDKTIIDGQIYFDREKDEELRQYIKTERARIINKMLLEKQKGLPVIKPAEKKHRYYHCNSVGEVGEEITGKR